MSLLIKTFFLIIIISLTKIHETITQAIIAQASAKSTVRTTSSAKKFDYCQLNCEFHGRIIKHTVCDRENNCGPVDKCQEIQLNNTLRELILNAHNELRSKVAVGNETRKNLTNAANMNLLEYDKDLEYVARCHINRCKLEHDICQRTEKFENVGQNLYGDSNEPASVLLNNLKGVVEKWYSEIDNINNNIVDKFASLPTDKFGYFTQIIWAETTHVGCAISQSNNKQFLMVCNYGPGGNFRDKPVYKRGSPCSECPEGIKCDFKFPGLCGESPRPPTTTTLMPPPARVLKTFNSVQSSIDLSAKIIIIMAFFVILFIY